MWAHYAAKHTGYVIGFDTTHQYWNNFGDEKGNDHAGVLRKVDYSDRRASPESDMPLLCLFSLPKESVREVLVGGRASEETENAIVEIVGGTKEYQKVDVLKAEIDPAEL